MRGPAKLVISRKYERDIDLLLAEEFAAAPDFAHWILSKTKKHKNIDADVAEVFVSRSDFTGESDLTVIFEAKSDNQRFAIHIEDKIDAPLMPDQETRYHMRAKRQLSSGEYVSYETALIAPAAYIGGHKRIDGFDFTVSFEEIADYFDLHASDPRRVYRSGFISTAIGRSTSQWERIVDEATDSFWSSAYEIARHDFPLLEMRRPIFTKNNNWITLRPAKLRLLPTNTYLAIKGPSGNVDLTFSNTQIQYFIARIGAFLPANMFIVQTGKSAAIRVEGAPFAISMAIADGMPAFRQALQASVLLMSFYDEHLSLIHDAITESQKAGV